MMREVVEYVAKYEVCQQVKVEHQKPARPSQPLMMVCGWVWEKWLSISTKHQKPAGPSQPLVEYEKSGWVCGLLIPEWKWENITMDFVSGLPRGKGGNDDVWFIVDRLTKYMLFLSIKMTDSVDKLAKLYVNKVVRLHGVPVSIVSNRDPRFTSHL